MSSHRRRKIPSNRRKVVKIASGENAVQTGLVTLLVQQEYLQLRGFQMVVMSF
jgi:hypothetical protein